MFEIFCNITLPYSTVIIIIIINKSINGDTVNEIFCVLYHVKKNLPIVSPILYLMFTKINNKINNKNNYLHYTDRCRQTATDTITEFCRISVLPLLGSVGIGQSLFSPTEYTALTFAGSWNVLEVTLLVGLVP